MVAKTVLDVSDRQTIVPVAELELSRTEDSVSSLANLATRDQTIFFPNGSVMIMSEMPAGILGQSL